MTTLSLRWLAWVVAPIISLFLWKWFIVAYVLPKVDLIAEWAAVVLR